MANTAGVPRRASGAPGPASRAQAPAVTPTETAAGGAPGAAAVAARGDTKHPPTGAHSEPGYIHQKDDQLKRLRRIEGQVRGLQRMVENDTYCIDILTQVSAATKALEAVALGLLQDHLKHCLVDAANDPDADLNAKLDEASAAIARLVRS